MKTAKLREEKELLDRKLNADSEAQKNLEENLQQLRNRESQKRLCFIKRVVFQLLLNRNPCRNVNIYVIAA